MVDKLVITKDGVKEVAFTIEEIQIREQEILNQQINPTIIEEQVDTEKVAMAEAIVNLTMELELLKTQIGGI